jgi:hypothetical protein
MFPTSAARVFRMIATSSTFLRGSLIINLGRSCARLAEDWEILQHSEGITTALAVVKKLDEFVSTILEIDTDLLFVLLECSSP